MVRLIRLSLVATFAFICLFAGTASAQSTVRGTVTDQLGSTVKDAKITLLQGDTKAGTTTSDGDGNFSFSAVNAGRYRIQVEAPGFEQYAGSDVSVGSSGAVVADVLLQVGTLKQEVVVSATGSAIPLAQVGASVTLIDSDEIQAENKLDVLENLRQVSGAQILQTSQRGGPTSLFIRGGESNFNKVLVDGAPVNSIGGGFDYAQLSNNGIESVEVLKGANSVLFGADALAGVVNITTKHGTSEMPELTFSGDGGNFHTYNRDVSFSGAFRKFDYFSDFSRYDTQGSFPNDFFHNQTYSGNFGWSPTATTDLRVTFRRTWAGLGSPNALYFDGIADDSSQKNQNTYATGTVQNQTTRRWHNLARFAYAQSVSTFTNPAPTGEPFDPGFGSGPNYLGSLVTIQGSNGYKVTGQAILDFGGAYPEVLPQYEARRSAYLQSDYNFVKDWTGTFGFRYEHENGSGTTRDNYSYFMEGHGNVGHRLYLTGGVGLEDNAVFGFAASPRVSAAYYLRRPSASTFFAETKLEFNFGKGIKEPSTSQQGSQLYELLTPAQRTQFNVGQIGPERSTGFDFGIEQGLFRGRSRLELTYFHNRFYDLITFLSASDLASIGVNPGAVQIAQFGAYVNASSTRSQGLEAQFVTEIGHGFRVQANYTYLDAVVTKAFGGPAFGTNFPDIPIGAFSPLEGERPFRKAPHTGTIGILYHHNKLTASFTGYMVSRRDDSTFLSDAFFGNTLLLPNRDLAPAYQKFDLSGRYNLRRWVSLYTGIENLFSQHYQAAFGFPAAPVTIRAGMTFTIGGEGWRK